MTPEEADRAQQWAGMDGAIAWHLIDRHADDWNEAGEMMNAWLRANTPQKWAPIETAPTGCDLLLAGVMDHDEDWRAKVGHRTSGHECGSYGFVIYGASWKPLRWMMLPAKPSNAEISRPREAGE